MISLLARGLRRLADRLDPASRPDLLPETQIRKLWEAVREMEQRIERDCAGLHEAGQIVQLEEGMREMTKRIADIERRIGRGGK